MVQGSCVLCLVHMSCSAPAGRLLRLPGRQALLHLLQPRRLGRGLPLLRLLPLGLPARGTCCQDPVHARREQQSCTPHGLRMVAAVRCCAACWAAPLQAARRVCKPPRQATLTSHPAPVPRCAARARELSFRGSAACRAGEGGCARLAAAAAASGASAAGDAANAPPAMTGACDRNSGRTTHARTPPATHTSAPSSCTWAPSKHR
jgi:hypothetical protein